MSREFKNGKIYKTGMKTDFKARLKYNIIINNLKQKPMKVSILSLSTARNLAYQIMPNLSGTKLGYAIQRNDKNILKALQEFYELQSGEQVAIEECFINNASVDEKGILLFTLTKDQQGNERKVYQYTKEGEIKKNKGQREIQAEYQEKRDNLLYDSEGKETEVEVELFLASEYPAKFPPNMVEIFKNVYLTQDAKEKIELITPSSPELQGSRIEVVK